MDIYQEVSDLIWILRIALFLPLAYVLSILYTLDRLTRSYEIAEALDRIQALWNELYRNGGNI